MFDALKENNPNVMEHILGMKGALLEQDKNSAFRKMENPTPIGVAFLLKQMRSFLLVDQKTVFQHHQNQKV